MKSAERDSTAQTSKSRWIGAILIARQSQLPQFLDWRILSHRALSFSTQVAPVHPVTTGSRTLLTIWEPMTFDQTGTFLVSIRVEWEEVLPLNV